MKEIVDRAFGCTNQLVWTGILLLATLLLAFPSPALADDKVTPLFRDSAVLAMEISGPVKKIARQAPNSTAPHPATLAANGETHAINLSARGVSRRQRDACRFPPLRIRIQEKPSESSLFHKQRSLKLVTHCRDNESYEQIAMREYTTYRLYNLFTPESLKVRLVRVTYRDGGDVEAQRMGFLIEDIDDAARRLGGKEIDVARVKSAALNADDAARYALFQYMIGNTDWAMIAGPAGSDCCHNSKLVGAGKEARSDLTPVPYDFDGTGLVNAPYAEPSERVPIRSVRTRYYRGFCKHNAQVKQIAPTFLAKRDAVMAEIATTEGPSDASRKQMSRYIEGFFKDIATPASVEKKLLKTCR